MKRKRLEKKIPKRKREKDNSGKEQSGIAKKTGRETTEQIDAKKQLWEKTNVKRKN